MKFAGLFIILTRILTIMAIALTVCLLLALLYHESIVPFGIPIIISSAAALLSFYINKRNDWESFHKKEAYLSVSIAWLVISVIGALPFLFSGYIPSVVDAMFESISGFTTTGSSILTDIEILPKSLLFWRSLTHWIGGIGIIVLVIVIMPRANINSYSIFSLESSLREKIHPRLRSVGYRLLFIYVLLTAVETVLLLLGKMNLFESLCHAFGTVSTGGFSPKNTSLADYSPYIQYVVTIFMILGGTNFIIHYFALKREFSKIKKNDEFIFYLKAIFIAGLVISAALYLGTERPLEQSFRDSFFQVASIVTCTGFATSDYLLWPEFAWISIFILMFLGGSTGSTAGGIKMVRHLVAFRSIQNLFRSALHPNSIFTLKINHKHISTQVGNSIVAYIYWYLIAFVIGSVLLVFMGLDGMTSTSAIATAMGGIGPGFGTIGPTSNFAHLPSMAKILISFFMLLGRLEIYTVVILFSPAYWKK